MYRCVCVRIAYLQACKAIDSENKIKQQSPHSHTDPPIHAHMHALFNSQPLMQHISFSLSLSHSSTMKAIELNHCRWQFSAICLVVVVVVGGGHFNRRRRRRRHNKLQRSATHGRAAQRSDARACCCSGCAALSHFAFHILTQRKAARLCPPPRAAFAVDFQCEMKSRG